MSTEPGKHPHPVHPGDFRRRRIPRSFKEMTPTNAFNPRTFFHEMVWKALLTKRSGGHKEPVFPKLHRGQVALTWIGHASFLVQFTDLNVLIDPNFANWLFLLKRIKHSGLKISHLPPIDLVLLTHEPDETVILTILRDGAEKTLNLTLGTRSADLGR